ncbi:breast cancer type 2 susceptibility protein isoform X2 [Carcharodon carcharias]|uniref:breast cancer type 2 susceptibility protein isoform X2 n=1 Tax=Carcharodon carcharias TaxID=13397 RepID=UPI001B7F2FB0|nr:breast cancer type 2 susceptibility protein isoform X2 [Carcharodon carcharias]
MTEQNSERAMFDFTVLCHEDLGPLCPNWFEELSLSASSNQLKQPRDDARCFTSSYFKTPWQKQTLYSQLDCTPSVFSGLTSITPSVSTPEKGNDQTCLKRGTSSYPAVAQRIIHPYKTTDNGTSNPTSDISLMKSPAVLHNTCKTPQHPYSVQDDGCSFFSPPVSYEVMSKQIPESLGAELDPDMSWTSSLATPPSLNPTVIICKAKENDLHQDKPKEVQVPLLLHSNLNRQSNAFAVGLNSACAMPVIGEEENEEVEAVDQRYVPEDGPDSVHNNGTSYEDRKLYISTTLPDGAMSFSETTHLELRKVKSYTRKRKKNSTVGNFQTNSIKTLLSPSTDEKGSSESIMAESSSNMVFSNFTLGPVKECNMKQLFLNKNAVNQNQSPDAHPCDKGSEKELSGHNITSSSDWSQLNLSELEENQMIDGYSGIVDSSTDALCLKNVGDLTFSTNENANEQQLDNASEEDIDKGSSFVPWEEMSPIVQLSTSHSLTDQVTKSLFNHCAVANKFITVDESTKSSGAEVKASTPNHSCSKMQLSKLPIPEIPYTDCFKIGDSTEIQPLIEGWMDSGSETVATRRLPFCKDAIAQMNKRINLEHKTNLMKPLATLEDQKVTFVDSVSDNMPIQPAVDSRMLSDGVYRVTDPETVKSISLALDSVKCQVDDEDHTFLLSSLKGRPRKFLYSVTDPSNRQAQNISLDTTELQNRIPILPLALEPSYKSSAQKSGKQLKSVPATYKENQEATSTEFVPGIDLSEASEAHDTEANKNLQHNHQFPKDSDRVENEVVHQHCKDETVDKLSDASSNGKNWDHFVTPLNSRPVSCNRRERRIFATACHTVAKRLTMESKVMLTNRSSAQAEVAEDSCVFSVVNSVQPEKACVIENIVVPNRGRSYFEFRLSPLSDVNRTAPHHDCNKTKLQGNTIICNELDSNFPFIPVSTQLSTKQLSCTSIISRTVSSHSPCIANVLHKTKKLFYNLKKSKRTLKKKAGLCESQQLESKENNEISTCLSKEKHFEGSLAVDKELSNEDQRLDLYTFVEAEKRECSVNTDFHIDDRKIALLASTLKSRKLIADVDNDAFLTSSEPALVQSLPECETKYMESTFTGTKIIPCDIPCSSISDLEMTLNESSELTEGSMNSHKETRASLSASIIETELYEFAQITQPSHCVVPVQEKNTSGLELKLQNAEADISSMTTIKEICTVSENTQTPLISGHAESCKRGPNCNYFKTAEQHTDLSAEIISKGKLLKKFENEGLEINSAQKVSVECITSKNRFRSQESNSPTISSVKAEVKTESPEPKVATENVKQPPLAFVKAQTFESSAFLSQSKLLGKYTCLTASQTEPTELFSILEDAGGQFERMQLRNQSAVDVTSKDTNLMISEHLGHTPPVPILDSWKDTDFGKSLDIEPSVLLTSKPCNSQQQAESSNTETRSKIYQQNTEGIEQTISDKLADSFVVLSNEERKIVSFAVPNFHTDSMELASNTVKMKSATILDQAIPPLKDKVSFNNSEYAGFCAASGNKIKLSVESLKKAANIFRDIDNDQTIARIHTIKGSDYLGECSVNESEKVTEDKLNDVQKTVKTNESYQLCGAHDNRFTVNTKSNGASILKSESKIENSERKISGFQSVGSRRFTISEEETLDKTIYLTTEQNVLHKPDTKDKEKPSTIRNTVWEKNAWQPGYNGAKDNGNNKLADSKMKFADDYLLQTTSVGHFKPFKASAIESAGEVKCFQTASGKRVSVSKGNLDKAKSLLEVEDCCSENRQNSKLPTGIAKNIPQQLDNMNTFHSHVEKNDVNMQLGDQTGSSQTVLNVSVCPAFIVHSKNSISEDTNSIQNNSLFATVGTVMKGFQTASGKMVPMCKASLDKAKTLFAEEDLLNKTTKHTDKNVSTESPCTHTCPQLIHSGIKSVVKKQLENDHSLEILHPFNLKSHGKLHDFSVQSEHVSEFTNLNNGTEMKGFQTASGRKVNVSKIALDKGRALFFEEDYNKLRIQDNLISTAKIKNALSEDNVLNDSEANLPQRLDMKNQMTSFPAKQPSGFCIENGNIVSVSDTNLKYVQEKCPADEPEESANSVSNVNQGDFAGDVSEPSQQLLKSGSIAFSTASGKSVCVSEESLKKCKHFFNEVGVDEKFVTGEDLKSKESRLSEETWRSDIPSAKTPLGFNTASGKAVLVSHDALQKVKHVLKEFDMSDGSSINPTYSEQTFYEKPQQLPLTSSSLFQNTAMSSKQACEEESSELIHKVSNDCTENISIVQNPAQVESSGREINRPTRNLTASTNKSVFLSGFQTAEGKEVMVEESSLTAARMYLASVENDNLDHTTERVNMHIERRIEPTCNINNVTTSIVRALESNHGTYAKMLENDMEKEAVKDSKALMEDDELFAITPGKAFRPTYDGTYQSIRPDLRTGKRLRSDGNTAREQPLPKRQLLSEFNRTIHSDQKVAFQPLICNPEGVLRDRRKFMYSVPLKPVICGPPKDKSISNRIHQQSISPNVTFPAQENSIQHNLCLQHEVKPLKGQAAVFKPPFQRHSGCIQQNSSRQSTSKPAKVFVPPFKTIPTSSQMETQEYVKIVSSPVQTEIGISMKATNCNKIFQDDGTLKDDMVRVRCVEDKLQSVSDTTEELQANAEGFSRIVQNWSCARDLQEMRLIKKRRQAIHPLPGSLYKTKTSGAPRLSLHAAVEGKVPNSFTEEQLYVHGVSRSTLEVRAENAESFQINCREFFSEELFKAGNGMQLADGGWLIPDNNGMAGKSEFYRALLDSPGVDPKLISEVWAYNHYKWLVWKFAAMETTFPKEFGGRCLTPETILLHLKYRYDIEIDQCHRPALKKIMERDDVAAKTLVVCVSRIISMGTKSFQNNPNLAGVDKQSKTVTEKSVIEATKHMPLGVIEVTDGWYGIKALLDLPLTSLLQKKRLVVGQKIIVHGAELIGSQDACTPLEAPESLMLKISANSTRPARWYAKLGFHRDPRPFPLPISALFKEGGMVGCVDVIVVRIYPMQWMEKKPNGMYVFRNERTEEREAQIHYENQQRKLEVLYAKIETQIQEQFGVDRKKKREHKIQKLSDQQIMMLQDGVDLYEAIQNSSDPSVEAYLNEQQLKALNNYRQLLKEQKHIQFEAEFRRALEGDQSENSYTKRDVTPVWKLCVVDYKSQDRNAAYMLNIWRPIADLHSLLKEGGRYWIYYLTTSSCKSRLSHAGLQLTATKKTRYQQLQPSLKVLEQLYQPRQAVTYSMLLDPLFGAVCKEVDLAGYVIHILGKSGAPTTLYLADENQNLIAVKVWAGLSQLALEDIIKPSTLVVASNLHWTSDSCKGIPILFTGDLSSFSANPKEGHLREKYSQLKNSVQNLQNFIKDTEEKVMTMLETLTTPRSSRDFGADALAPTQRKSNFVPVNSTVPTSSDGESKLRTLSAAGSRPALRSTKITSDDSLTNLKKKKLSFLSRIPSPVPLSPLCNSVSPAVQKGFIPPRRCVTPQSREETIQTESNKLSQVSSLKRTEISKIVEDNWVTDEELAMINTQALREGWANVHCESEKGTFTKGQIISSKAITLLSENVKNHLDIDLGSQISKLGEDNWVTDEELAMINTQALFEGCANRSSEKDGGKVQKSHIVNTTDVVLLPQNSSYLDSEVGNKVFKIVEDNWVADEELALINTQALCEGWVNGSSENNRAKIDKAQVVSSNDTTSLQQNVKMYLDHELETVIASPDRSPPVESQSKRRCKNEASMVNSSEDTSQSERTVTAQNNDGDKAAVQDGDNLDNKQVLSHKLQKNRNKIY